MKSIFHHHIGFWGRHHFFRRAWAEENQRSGLSYRDASHDFPDNVQESDEDREQGEVQMRVFRGIAYKISPIQRVQAERGGLRVFRGTAYTRTGGDVVPVKRKSDALLVFRGIAYQGERNTE